jgi:SWI/SNF-related matrix-associated actin-dependent regulator 1 of chromatin subfamily A
MSLAYAENAEYVANGYEDAIHTRQMAVHCLFCHRPLVDPTSVERGCGPDCAEKFMIDVPSGDIDEEMIRAGIAQAPDLMQQDLLPYFDRQDYRGLVKRAIWHAAIASYYKGAGAASVMAALNTVAKGAGYAMVANRIAAMEIKPWRISHEPGQAGHIRIEVPKNNTFREAIRNIPGRRFADTPPRWIVKLEYIQHAVNALALAWPGQIMIGPEGNAFVIPDKPVPILPPPTPPAPPPTQATGEAPEGLQHIGGKEVVKGMIVVDPTDGQKREVGWVGFGRGQKSIGLRIPGQRGFKFVAYDEVKYMPAEKVIKVVEKEWKEDASQAQALNAPVPPLPDMAMLRKVPAEAFPYQVEGVQWLDKVGSGILGDDQGLGKTIQSLTAADAPILIVCKAKLRVNWIREIAKWRPELSATMVLGTKPVDDATLNADAVVVNYDIISKQEARLATRKWKTMIVDESQYIKNVEIWPKKNPDGSWGKRYSGTKWAQAIVRLSEVCERKFLLSGTPVPAKPIELFSQLYIVAPKVWYSRKAYGARYCEAHQKHVGGGRMVWDYDGAANLAELHQKINNVYLLRRTKEQVLKDLPEKSRRSEVVTLEEPYASEYAKAAKEFIRWVEENGGPEAVARVMRAQRLAKMTALRHLSAVAKIDHAVEWAQQHYESTQGKPLLIWAHHRDVIEGVGEKCRQAGLSVGYVYGGYAKAQDDIDAFQAGKLNILMCGIMAAKEGLTLTAASEALFVERDWTPSNLVQAEDREHRIGQKNAVTITYLEAAGTIDLAIAALLQDKIKTVAAIIDGQDLSDDDAADRVFGALFGEGGQRLRNPSSVPEQIELPWNWYDPTDIDG